MPSGHLGLLWCGEALILWVEELEKLLDDPPDLLAMICTPDVCLCNKENKSPGISSPGLGNWNSAVPGTGLGHASQSCTTRRGRSSAWEEEVGVTGAAQPQKAAGETWEGVQTMDSTASSPLH